MKTRFSRERLREIIWDVAHGYPIAQNEDAISFLMVNPHLGYLTWHIREQSVNILRAKHGGAFANAALVMRVYDVTDILFEGSNAHMFFDIDVGKRSGNYYFGVDRLGRNYLAEIGLRNMQGVFYPLDRSNTAFFDRDRPSGNYQARGLFVGNAPNRIFQVDNIFDAPVYERLNYELSGGARDWDFSAAMVYLNIDGVADSGKPLGQFIENLSTNIQKLSGDVRVFSSLLKRPKGLSEEPLISVLDYLSINFFKKIREAHKQKPFHIIHCHDWCSAAVGLALKREFNLPLVLTLHSTEHERGQSDEMNLSIYQREKDAVTHADLVIVPDSSARQQMVTLYEASPEKVVVVDDVLDEKSSDRTENESEIRKALGLSADAPTALFAGEISYASGADILVDALPTVCRDHPSAQFVFAGDGPLKWELETRASHAGISHRCRFLGDVTSETFASILGISDFVVIPARARQDGGVAQAAIMRGRPVLTTHQAGINGIVHGQNGLVAYDNPGSIVWGIKEMLHNSLKGSMLRLAAKKKAGGAPSVEAVAVQHYLYYEMLLKDIKSARDV
jgi:glycosyltransferase involved in cell wall biosynthesis